MSGWHRSSRHERGYGSRWVRMREAVLRMDSHLCQPCLREGRVTAATEVDHIVPKSKGGPDEIANLQSICSACHKAKTAVDEGRRLRREVGADGYPLG